MLHCDACREESTTLSLTTRNFSEGSMQSANNNVLELKPFYINFLAESVEHMLVFRNGAEYAMQNAS
jgi:hypothetical protein